MGILRDFESRLERIVEGAFTKAFRSGVHPVELARRIMREMEAHKTVGVKEIWVPNRYVIHLAEDDRERFSGMERGLAGELEQVVVQGARERGFGLVAAPQVTFQTDPGLKRGDFRLDAELTEETGPAPSDGAPLPGHAILVLLEEGKAAREFALREGPAVIGRMEGSDIEISDPGASRRHAEVRKQGPDFVLADLGSTNGTMVNGSEVGQHTLTDGDRITIGRTVLEFRRG
ncbi:MAG TPA: DUF3662 and FHA domain-containing protein [Actinomycetota bacterium]|jgi:hypothetical protein